MTVTGRSLVGAGKGVLELLSMGGPQKDISTHNLPVVSHMGWEMLGTFLEGPSMDIPGTCIMGSGMSGCYWYTLGSCLYCLGYGAFFEKL